jgi:peptidyl-prolyl cis-trans isomerase B (cyclophilin B)
VFGKVAKCHGVVNKMKGVATSNKGPHADVPLETINIIKESVEDE